MRPYQDGRTHLPKVTKRQRQQTKEEEDYVYMDLHDYYLQRKTRKIFSSPNTPNPK